MRGRILRRVRRVALLSILGGNAMAVDISSLWDHGKPDVSEQRFREALRTASGDDTLVLQTQIARTHGIRKDFARAREVLASIEPQARVGSPEVRVHNHLELGRTYASATHAQETILPEQRSLARSHYMQAFEAARKARLDNLAIDALHMMAFVDTDPKAQLAWDLKALRQFRLSLAAHERAGRARNARIAHWMIAWTLRAQRKFDEANAIQLRLEREWDAAGEPDPYVFEELEHLYRATGDPARAQAYAQKLRGARK